MNHLETWCSCRDCCFFRTLNNSCVKGKTHIKNSKFLILFLHRFQRARVRIAKSKGHGARWFDHSLRGESKDVTFRAEGNKLLKVAVLTQGNTCLRLIIFIFIFALNWVMKAKDAGLDFEADGIMKNTYKRSCVFRGSRLSCFQHSTCLFKRGHQSSAQTPPGHLEL